MTSGRIEAPVGGNIVYVRNVSPLADEKVLVSTFSTVDDVKVVEFRKYPGSQQRYAVIEFGSSKGVTDSHSLNQTPVLGVPLVISVLPPPGVQTVTPDDPNSVDLGGPGSVLDQLPSFSAGATEQQLLKRTVQVAGLTPQLTEGDIRSFFNQAVGIVNDFRMGKMAGTDEVFALLEFSRDEEAQLACREKIYQFKGTRVIVSPSKITVPVVVPPNVVFGKPFGIGKHTLATTATQRQRREAVMARVDRVIRDLERELMGSEFKGDSRAAYVKGKEPLQAVKAFTQPKERTERSLSRERRRRKLLSPSPDPSDDGKSPKACSRGFTPRKDQDRPRKSQKVEMKHEVERSLERIDEAKLKVSNDEAEFRALMEAKTETQN